MDTRVWTRNGIALGIGAFGGVIDTVGTNHDAKAIQDYVTANPGKKLNVIKQWGTYINYLIPTVEFMLAGFEIVKGNMATILSTQAGSLVGAKLARNFTQAPFGSKKNYTLTWSSTPSPYTRDQRSVMPPPTFKPAPQYITPTNPQPMRGGEVVPIVTPQGNFGFEGLTG